ncbi:MAG TPA: hypothetical protein VF599_04930 [Pyrinomonadaceae bacterium]|jgi:hypothetical protein
MKLTRNLLAIAISLSLVFISSPYLSIQQTAGAQQQQQDTRAALQRGYRTGYSDGYMAGYRDVIENATRSFQRHGEYEKADRAFSKDYGALEDYQDGYRQGFESGYNTGFDKRSFDASLPPELRRRGNVQTNTTSETIENTETENPPIVSDKTAEQNQNVSTVVPVDERSVIIPVETELIIELVEGIDTEQSRTGDKFQARVVSPAEISGALVEGRIAKIQKPGRIKRRAEMQLSFDRINLGDNRWGNYNAILTEVLPLKGDGVKRVDVEGTVEGKRNYKKDAAKLGASTGGGAVVGGLIGGPVGAGVGAGVGAAFGVGAVVVERGKHIKLIRGQQLRIKTAYETQIR